MTSVKLPWHCKDRWHAYVSAHEFFKSPRSGEVYNIGGGVVAIVQCSKRLRSPRRFSGKPLQSRYVEQNRRGDHIWWISDTSRFEHHYPEWKQVYDVPQILKEIYDFNIERWTEERPRRLIEQQSARAIQ